MISVHCLVRYVATNGSDSNSGSSSSPYATLSKAVSASASNDTIVVGGGLYRGQRNITIKPGLRIIAQPNQIPEFRGSEQIPSANSGGSGNGWTAAGASSYRPYKHRPYGNGGGVCFFIISATDCPKTQNVNIKPASGLNNVSGYAGKYADQVWIGNTPLQQVVNQSDLKDGRFWVDSANNRLYLTINDAVKSQIETSRQNTGDRDRVFDIGAANVTIEGIKITRYSPNASDYGAITVEASGTKFKLKNVEISQLPFEGIHVAAGNSSTVLQNITMSYVAWQGINTDQTDNFVLDYAMITNTDYFDEFEGAPASGAVKTSRNRNTTITNSIFSNNKSQGLWFDQSNINTITANNVLTDNSNASIFFEISDGFYMINNYIKSSGGAQPVKLAGSSGIVLVNNTLVGGVDPIGVYTDPRSKPGCASAANGYCQISSDVQTRYPRPATMDWMPRIDMMINNIVAYPNGATYCGGAEPLCIMTSHSAGATAPIQTIIHKADNSRGIPQTIINGNVYANGAGVLIRVSNPAANYSSLSSWTSAMAGSPVSIAGIDANSKSGNTWVNSDGSPTSSLAAAHNQAVAVPTNTVINKYIPAGTKHYGVLNK